MYRAYKLKLIANKRKLDIIDDILISYRKTATFISKLYWNNFIRYNSLPKYISLNSIRSDLSERYKRTCANQVHGILLSYISNRVNDFERIICNSSIKDGNIKTQLLFINKYHRWLSNGTMMDGWYFIEHEIEKLARKIFKHLLKINKFPKVDNISMALDGNIATISKSKNNSIVDYWIRLSTKEKRKRISLPIISNSYYEGIKTDRVNFIQINKDQDNNFSISFIKKLETHKDIVFKTEKIGIDLGLANLFTINDGSIYGSNYIFDRLKYYDKKICDLMSDLQRRNIKPRKSKKYRTIVNRLRNFLKNEINRLMNKIFNRYIPKIIVIERLNFQFQKLSRRLNRIVGNFGKSIIQAKLKDFNEKYSVNIEEVNPVYTSQICSSCGYISKKNRKSQSVFICACCGLKLHADINAAKNIVARSSSAIGDIYKSKAFILDKLIARFIERQVSHYSLARVISSNPYFSPYSKNIAMIADSPNINGIV